MFPVPSTSPRASFQLSAHEDEDEDGEFDDDEFWNDDDDLFDDEEDELLMSDSGDEGIE